MKTNTNNTPRQALIRAPDGFDDTHRARGIVVLKRAIGDIHGPVGIHCGPFGSCVVDKAHIGDTDQELLQKGRVVLLILILSRQEEEATAL